MAAQPSLAYTDSLEARAVRAVLRKGIAESGARLRYAASSSYRAPAGMTRLPHECENPYSLRLPLRTDSDGPATDGPLRVLRSRGARDGPAAELRERLQPSPAPTPPDPLEALGWGVVRRARQRDKPLDERLAVQLGSCIGPEDATTTINANVQGLDIPVRLASKRLAVSGPGGVELRPARYTRYQAEETPQADGARLQLLQSYANDRITPLNEGLDFLETKVPAIVLEAEDRKERLLRSPERGRHLRNLPVPSPGLFDPHVDISQVPGPNCSTGTTDSHSIAPSAGSQSSLMAAQSEALANGQRATPDRVSLERTVQRSLLHLHGLATRVNPEGAYVSGSCPCDCHRLTPKQLRFVSHRRCPICLCPYGGRTQGSAGDLPAPGGTQQAAPDLLVTEDLLHNQPYRQVYSRTYDDAAPVEDAGNDLTDVSLDSDREAEEEARTGVSVTHHSGLTTLQERELLRRHLSLLGSDLQSEDPETVARGGDGSTGARKHRRDVTAAFDPMGPGRSPQPGESAGPPSSASQRFPPAVLSRSASPSALDIAARKQVVLADRLYTERLLADVSPSRSPEDVAALIYAHRFMDNGLRAELDGGNLVKGQAEHHRLRRNEQLRRQLLARSDSEIRRSLGRGSALNAGAVASADKTLRKNMAYLEGRRKRIAEGESLTASYMGMLRDAAATTPASQQAEFVLPSLRRDMSYSRELHDSIESSLSDREAVRAAASSLRSSHGVGEGGDASRKARIGTLDALDYYTQRPESRAVLRASLLRSATPSGARGVTEMSLTTDRSVIAGKSAEAVSGKGEPTALESGSTGADEVLSASESMNDFEGSRDSSGGSLASARSSNQTSNQTPDQTSDQSSVEPQGSPARLLSPEIRECLFDSDAPAPLLRMGQVRGAVRRARSRLDAVQRGAPSQSGLPPSRAAIMKEEMTRSLAESALAEIDPDPRVNATVIAQKRMEQSRRARAAALQAMEEQRAIAEAYDSPWGATRTSSKSRGRVNQDSRA